MPRRAVSTALLLALAACAVPTPSRPESLAARRARNIELLRAYAERAEFPRNDDFPGERVPYFVDHHGTPCAVAYLMLQDGQEETVRSVATRDNHVRIADLREGPVLEWILGSGLTQEECALIQPCYARKTYTSDPLEQIDPGVARLRLSPWVIPSFYRNRPNLSERLRIRSHLLDVIAALEGRTLEISGTVVATRVVLGSPPLIRPQQPSPIRTYRWVSPPRIVVLEEAYCTCGCCTCYALFWDPPDPLEIFVRRFEPWPFMQPDRSGP